AAYELLHLGANRAAGGGDDQAVALTPAYVDGALEVTLTSAAPLAEGLYRLTVRSDATNGLQNLAAEFLDQNQDGTPDPYVATLEVDLTPPAVSGVAAGTCLVYDDGYDMVTLPHEALNGLAAYTLELWFQTTKTNGQSLISAIQSGNTAAVQFWLTNGTLYVESASSSVSATLDGVYDGRWHHLAVTYSDAADRMEIIYDGRLLTSAGYTGAPPSVSPGSFIVGQEQDAPAGAMDAGQAFSGALTELRLWDYARSRAEVDAMRFQRAAGDEAGLRACWHFDEGTTTITDATGNGFDGVLGDWNSGDLPRWQPATAWWNDHRTLYVTYLDIGGMDTASVQDTANYTILASGGDGVFDDGNEVDLTASLQSVRYVPATRGAVLAFDATLPQDMVQVTIRGTATVRDAAGHALLGGNDYVSPGVPVALGVPAIAAVVAPETDTGFSDSDGITSQTLPGFRVTVDQPGTIAVDSARNGSWEASRDVTAAGSWRVDAVTPFADGATTVPVRFTSWLGAVATTSVALTVDTTPPEVGAVTAGTALSFDGSNDYVVTTAKTWGFTTSATLAAWVKTTDDTGTLISLAHGDVNNELLLLISGGKAQVIQHRQPGSYWYRNGTSVINLGRWVHVAAVFDGTGVNAMRVFVNGIEEPLGTTGQAGSPAAVSDATPRWVALGGRLRGGSRSELLAGQIDEAQVWSRALSPAEVAALVATAPVGNEPGLAGLWRLNEGVGTTVVDAVAGCNG
ncbi:MAG: hypothetical protein GX595_20780, partial [Lentisphaerae bacterium]|nr:hypothetical protein [Lentisphaerota bacterium]